ncbi:MAG: hypothetical protein ACLR2O_09000 [Coprococcus sp.]
MAKVSDGRGISCGADEAVRTLHQPAYRWLQEHLAEIGPVRAATLCYDQKSSKLDRLKSGDLTNNFNHEYAGGALTDIGVYRLQERCDRTARKTGNK